MVEAIRDGAGPIPAAEPDASLTSAQEPSPPTQTVFMMKSAKYPVADRCQPNVAVLGSAARRCADDPVYWPKPTC